MEKIVSQSGEKEEEGEEVQAEEVKNKEKDNGDENEEEAITEALDKTEKKTQILVQSKETKLADVLNLNNEVVKMRKEVKRVRALIIRKLTRQIGALKKKKGKETEIERNQKRAARLLEEIHAMKVLVPDLVTKMALQKNLNFQEVCKNPKSAISDRAIARIATHPQFNKKIEDIKNAVKAFKEDRMKAGKQGGKNKVQNQDVKTNPQLQDEKVERIKKKEEEESTAEYKEGTDIEEGDGILIDTKSATVSTAHSADSAHVQKKDKPEPKSAKAITGKSNEVKAKVKDEPQSKDSGKQPNLRPASAVLQKRIDDEESDLESLDGEEKEYFDDSTEERFHKQSSQSEESEDDDFFVGKVSKFKSRKKPKSKEVEEKVEKKHEIKKESTDKVQSELDELESRLKSKATSVQSVFCSSLSRSKHSGRGGGAGRGKCGEKVRGKEKTEGGPSRDFSKESKFQKHDKGSEKNVSKYNKPESIPQKWQDKGFATVGRGRGRGKGDVMKRKDFKDKGVFSKQTPQQTLHPSWEASRKRKEQQGQILAFQGKKIKFDDDD